MTVPPPEIRPDDLVQFVENHRPFLPTGDYTIAVDQSLKIDGAADVLAEVPATALDFTVEGERFTLAPDLIHAVFPPQGARGAFDNALPHAVFTRSTLPWERWPLGGGVLDPNSPSWLALLVLTEQEAAAATPHLVTIEKTPGADGYLTDDAALFEDGFARGSSQHPGDQVRVIDMAWDTLGPLLPRYHDLGVMAHVRRVTSKGVGATGGMDILPADARPDHGADALAATSTGHMGPAGAGAPDGAPGNEVAVVFANRLPPADADCVVHLVSLEHRYRVPEEGETSDRPVRKLADPTLRAWLLAAETRRANARAQACTLDLRVGAAPTVMTPDAPTVPDLNAPTGESWAKLLGIDATTAICKAILGPDMDRWRVPLDAMAEVTSLGLFDCGGPSPLLIRAHVRRMGGEAGPLSPAQVAVLAAHAPIMPMPAALDLRIQGADASAIDDDAHARLQAWITLKTQDALATERDALAKLLTTLSPPAPTPACADDLTALLTARPALVAAVAAAGPLSADQLARIGAMPGDDAPAASFSLRGIALTATPHLTGSNGAAAVLSARIMGMAARLDVLAPEPVFHAPVAQPGDLVRLVALKTWRFHADPAHRGFVGELLALNGAAPPDLHDKATSFSIPSAMFETPMDPPAADAPDAVHESARYMHSGAVPLRHRLRGGGRTVSWYHGPFLSRPGAGARMPLPARGADQMLIYNTALGMFDASYAAAWQLGRMVALEDADFAAQLYRWKRDHARTLSVRRQNLDHDYLPLARRGAAPDMPATLSARFRALTLLEGLPFNYLAPDERLLPPESIRFFSLDPMWIEALRDGAFSVGRVLDSDHLADAAHWADMPAAPALSGFLLRSRAVTDWPQMVVEGFADVNRSDPRLHHALEFDAAPLTLERMARLGPNVMLCLFSDPERAGRQLELAQLHLPAEALHFGLERSMAAKPDAPPTPEKPAGLFKQLRDPRSGLELRRWRWADGADAGHAAGCKIDGALLDALHCAEAPDAGHAAGCMIDGALLDALHCAGTPDAVIDKLSALVNQGAELSWDEFLASRVKGDPADGGAGLTEAELSCPLKGAPKKTLRDLIERGASNAAADNQMIARIPKRQGDVLDLTALMDDAANLMAPAYPRGHRFSAADFALQMLDLPPSVRVLRPKREGEL